MRQKGNSADTQRAEHNTSPGLDFTASLDCGDVGDTVSREQV